MLLTHALALSAKSCFLRDRVDWYKCAPCKTPTKLLRKVIVVGTRTTYQASGDARTEMPPARLFFMPKCKVEDWPLHFMFVVHLYLTSRFFYIYPLSSMVIAARTKQSNRGSVDHFCNATNCNLSLSTLTKHRRDYYPGIPQGYFSRRGSKFHHHSQYLSTFGRQC